MTEEQIRQKATECAKECFCYDSETYSIFERGFWEGVKYGAIETTKELQEEVNELREQHYADVELVEKSSIAIKQVIKAKEIINNLLSDNRIMKAQFESEEQAQVWFKHIEQAEAFFKE